MRDFRSVWCSQNLIRRVFGEMLVLSRVHFGRPHAAFIPVYQQSSLLSSRSESGSAEAITIVNHDPDPKLLISIAGPFLTTHNMLEAEATQVWCERI